MKKKENWYTYVGFYIMMEPPLTDFPLHKLTDCLIVLGGIEI